MRVCNRSIRSFWRKISIELYCCWAVCWYLCPMAHTNGQIFYRRWDVLRVLIGWCVFFSSALLLLFQHTRALNAQLLSLLFWRFICVYCEMSWIHKDQWHVFLWYLLPAQWSTNAWLVARRKSTAHTLLDTNNHSSVEIISALCQWDQHTRRPARTHTRKRVCSFVSLFTWTSPLAFSKWLSRGQSSPTKKTTLLKVHFNHSQYRHNIHSQFDIIISFRTNVLFFIKGCAFEHMQ